MPDYDWGHDIQVFFVCAPVQAFTAGASPDLAPVPPTDTPEEAQCSKPWLDHVSV